MELICIHCGKKVLVNKKFQGKITEIMKQTDMEIVFESEVSSRPFGWICKVECRNENR